MVEADTRHAAHFRQKAAEAAVAGQSTASLIAARRALLLAPFDPASCYYLSLSSRTIGASSDSGRFAHWAAAALPGRCVVPLHRELFTLAGLSEDNISMLRRAALMAPENGDGHYNLGNADDRANQPEDALGNFRRAQIARPLHTGTLGNIARLKALIMGGEDAEEAVRRALSATPADFLSLRNCGLWRRRKNDPRGAVGWFRRAVAVNPQSREAQGELGRALMIVGAFQEGWRRLEYFRLPAWLPPIEGLPKWEGRPLASGSLLLWSMDQIGDELQFSIFLQRAVEAADRVTLLVDPRNRALFRELYPEVRVIDSIDEVLTGGAEWRATACYPFDFVGRFFARGPADLSERGRERVLQRPRRNSHQLRIGISWWSGAPIIGGLKSTALEDWARLLKTPGCCFVSLQYGEGARDWKMFQEIESIPGFDPYSPTLDFAERVAELDLVITVGNTTAHIAARTTTPVWVLLASGLGPSWIWLRKGSRTPAYPNARLFRQPVPGDWKPVFRQVQSELSAWVQSRE
ncbi:tetratricopeptide repeat-containing glycosyltransferase family protein [Nisaea denitrificans]|uniref:tetratricopeptide repeat-containing glycosyltransferase family protein n=1 Tax=Nisaea denitrificans TaxID=390877 RepID=UPI00040809C4|nr:tetratricopeptide repeat-containing glycosyltransferase family protein [Nisaea denitrificans]